MLFPKNPRTITISLPENLRKFGYLELKADTNSEVAEVWNELLLKLAIVLTFCVVLSAVVYGILGRALEPLGDVSEAFARLGKGDYDARVPIRGPLELQRLGQGFNDMAERLSDMEEHNQALNDQLATVQEEERSDLARDLHDEVSPFCSRSRSMPQAFAMLPKMPRTKPATPKFRNVPMRSAMRSRI